MLQHKERVVILGHYTFFLQSSFPLRGSNINQRLQSCVGTWARLGYAKFDVQLQKAYFVATLYAIRMSVRG